MQIARAEFLEKFKETFVARHSYDTALSYWKIKQLIEEGETYFLPESDCIYMIRNRHLLVYDAPDNRMHLSADELNALDCLSLPASLYDSVKDRLTGFEAHSAWRLRYDFSYHPSARPSTRYEAVDFDFANPDHDAQAAAIISGGDPNAFNANRVRKMTTYTAFDPSLWFFVRDMATGEFAAVSISEYDEDVKQTDLDWIYVAPAYQGKGCGRFLMEETVRRCRDKSDDICVAGTVDFYRKCGFVNAGLWVFASKPGYDFNAPRITP